MKTNALRALVLALMLAGCSSTGEDGPLTGGGSTGALTGVVSIGPICPVEQEGVPCPVPPETLARVAVVVLDPDGDVRARASLAADGGYRVELPAGSYRVTLDHDLGIDRGAAPTHAVRIEAGATTAQDFDIDTGIR